MNWNQIFTVYRKELKDALRDRRSLISMFVVPAVVIPVLTLGAATLAVKAAKKAKEEIPTVMIVGGADSPGGRAALAANKRVNVVPFSDDYARRIEDKQLRAAVEIPDGFDVAIETGAKPPLVTVYSYSGEIRSGFAAGELKRFLENYRAKKYQEKLAARNLPGDFGQIFTVKEKNVAPPEKIGGAAVGGLIPYLLILLCFTGAIYTAIDLTAGEKERGTMETILCSPVGRTELVLGKFLMVLTASLVTVLCSLASLALTSALGVSLLMSDTAAKGATGANAAPPISISVPGLLGVCLLVIPLAVLFSAVLFSVALQAKSSKEAQSYLTPLVFVIILPAMFAMMPGVELNMKLALVPLVNVALVSKEMVSGNFPWAMIALIFVSTCVYAAVALRVAVGMFKRESVLFRV